MLKRVRKQTIEKARREGWRAFRENGEWWAIHDNSGIFAGPFRQACAAWDAALALRLSNHKALH